jgi:hypothetical protein
MNREQAEAIADFLQIYDDYKKLQSWLKEIRTANFYSWGALPEQILKDMNEEHQSKVVERMKSLASYSKKEVFLRSISSDTREKLLKSTLKNDKEFLKNVVNPPIKADIVRICDTSQGREFLVLSRRSIVERKELSFEDLSDKGREKTSLTSEVYVRDERLITAFDVVFVPHNPNLPVEVRISHDFKQGYSPKTKAHIEALKVERVISNKIFGEENINVNSIFEPIELFGAVEKLYQGSEGSIVELHFDCPTGASRREVTRRTGIDLREEEFHANGASVTEVWPYRVAVRWGNPGSDLRELFLPGTAQMLRTKNGLESALVRKVVSHVEYESAINVLLSHLG